MVESPFKERNSEILRLLATGVSPKLICQQLGISKSTVSGVKSRFGNPEVYKRKCRLRRARVVEARARKCLKERKRRVDAVLARKSPLPDLTVEWLNYYKEGLNIVAIGKLYQTYHQTVAKEFKRIGLDVKGLSIQPTKWGSKSSITK